jgi:hypothetical protein
MIDYLKKHKWFAGIGAVVVLYLGFRILKGRGASSQSNASASQGDASGGDIVYGGSSANDVDPTTGIPYATEIADLQSSLGASSSGAGTTTTSGTPDTSGAGDISSVTTALQQIMSAQQTNSNVSTLAQLAAATGLTSGTITIGTNGNSIQIQPDGTSTSASNIGNLQQYADTVHNSYVNGGYGAPSDGSSVQSAFNDLETYAANNGYSASQIASVVNNIEPGQVTVTPGYIQQTAAQGGITIKSGQ